MAADRSALRKEDAPSSRGPTLAPMDAAPAEAAVDLDRMIHEDIAWRSTANADTWVAGDCCGGCSRMDQMRAPSSCPCASTCGTQT